MQIPAHTIPTVTVVFTNLCPYMLINWLTSTYAGEKQVRARIWYREQFPWGQWAYHLCQHHEILIRNFGLLQLKRNWKYNKGLFTSPPAFWWEIEDKDLGPQDLNLKIPREASDVAYAFSGHPNLDLPSVDSSIYKLHWKPRKTSLCKVETALLMLGQF